MSLYKITNITNLVGKRDYKYNSILDIEYVDNMTKKNKNIKPGESIYLQIDTLPLSIHRLRVKNLITVAEVSESEISNNKSSVTPEPLMEIENQGEESDEVLKKVSKPKKK